MNAPPEDIIHQSNSCDGLIAVSQHNTMRSLYLGSDAKQSCIDISNPHQLQLRYTQAMMLSLIFTSSLDHVLCVGLGGGAIPLFLLQHLSQTSIDVIEKRQDVVKIAHGYFALPETTRLRIQIGDGADYMSSQPAGPTDAPPAYNVIFVDAYDHSGMPSALKSVEFFQDCRDRLSINGVCAINLWRNKGHDYEETIANLNKAFEKNVLLLPIEGRGNIIAFACPSNALFVNLKRYRKQAIHWQNSTQLPLEDLLKQLRRSNRWRWLQQVI